MADDLITRDARHVWHPYTQAATEPAPIPVRAASGARLVLEDGTELVDGISSWWATLHGHGEPRLVEAARAQMERLDHVLFAGATHEPGVALAEELGTDALLARRDVIGGTAAARVAAEVERWKGLLGGDEA